MSVGEKIREYRKKAGLTQKKLGEISGTSERTIQQYETGKRQPRLKQLKKIAEALSLDIKTFIDDYEELPDCRNHIYGTKIDGMIDRIKYYPLLFSEEERKELISEMKTCLKNGEKIDDADELYEYYCKAEIQFSHNLLDLILKKCSRDTTSLILDLLVLFLSCKIDARYKINEYALDLWHVKHYQNKAPYEDEDYGYAEE